MSEESDRIALGKIGRPHGVNGEVRLFLFNPESETLSAGMEVFLVGDEADPKKVEIKQIRYTPKFVILKFAGINSRWEIDIFKHAHLEVSQEDLPELEEDEFYHVDLLGIPVYVADEEDGDLPDGAEPIGEVSRFFETGANDVFVVGRKGGKELFVPLVEHAVSLIDFEREVVVLQPLDLWTPPEDEEPKE